MIAKRKLPWFAQQSWVHTLFMHWPVTPESLEAYIPKALNIDTFDGSAWISIVTFHAEDSRLRLSPKWTSLDPVAQINVRTYVTYPGSNERGVYFFTIHIQHLTAALGAKTLFKLPFCYAQTMMQEISDNTVEVRAEDAGKLLFEATYTPLMDQVVKSELGAYLAERYCIWNVKGDQVIKIPIKHQRWDLYQVDVTIPHNEVLPLDVGSSNPIAFYSPFKETTLYPYETYGTEVTQQN